jgi:hypothetical protein
MALRLEKFAATLIAILVIVVSSITVLVDSARAQNPELGDESDMGMGAGGTATGGASAGASWSTGTTGQATGTATTPAATTSDTSYQEESSGESSYTGGSDHSAMVGNFGIGYLGVTGVPIALAGSPGAAQDPTQYDQTFGEYVSAPTIGMRYWLSDLLGIEVGLGIGISSGSLEAQNAAGTTIVYDPPSATGFALHAGLPLALAHSGHFVFEIVPDLNFGFSTGTIYGQTAAEDVDIGGLLLQLGARAGAEIHFGFIDIPQLALQGSIGLYLSYESRSADYGDGSSVSQSDFSIGTSWREDPWDLFMGNVAAIYYFP